MGKGNLWLKYEIILITWIFVWFLKTCYEVNFSLGKYR